jgi:hypothetical protein
MFRPHSRRGLPAYGETAKARPDTRRGPAGLSRRDKGRPARRRAREQAANQEKSVRAETQPGTPRRLRRQRVSRRCGVGMHGSTSRGPVGGLRAVSPECVPFRSGGFTDGPRRRGDAGKRSCARAESRPRNCSRRSRRSSRRVPSGKLRRIKWRLTPRSCSAPVSPFNPWAQAAACVLGPRNQRYDRAQEPTVAQGDSVLARVQLERSSCRMHRVWPISIDSSR